VGLLYRFCKFPINALSAAKNGKEKHPTPMAIPPSDFPITQMAQEFKTKVK